MLNPDFKAAAVTVYAALASAMILLAFACILPYTAIDRLSNDIKPMLHEAISCAGGGDFNRAAELSANIKDTIEDKLKSLELFFGHDALYELYGAAISAEAIAPTEDPAQLLDELCAVNNMLEYLISINKISIYNLL